MEMNRPAAGNWIIYVVPHWGHSTWKKTIFKIFNHGKEIAEGKPHFEKVKSCH